MTPEQRNTSRSWHLEWVRAFVLKSEAIQAGRKVSGEAAAKIVNMDAEVYQQNDVWRKS